MSKAIGRENIYREITDKIIAELERGIVPWVQPWTNTQPALPLGASGQWPDPPQLFRHQYSAVVVWP